MMGIFHTFENRYSNGYCIKVSMTSIDVIPSILIMLYDVKLDKYELKHFNNEKISIDFLRELHELRK